MGRFQSRRDDLNNAYNKVNGDAFGLLLDPKDISIMSRRRIRFMANLRSPGLWLFVGGLEMLFMVHLSEFLYPGYSVSSNFISDLGVGPALSRGVFTAALLIFGLLALIVAALLRQQYRKFLIWPFLALSGIGAMGVAIFNENDLPEVHALFALLAFLFGNLAVVYSHRMVRRPLNYIFVFLGLVGLLALILFGLGVHLGLGAGGMERMVFYPPMFWAIGFGAYLLARQN